jgi:hypothetical protein
MNPCLKDGNMMTEKEILGQVTELWTGKYSPLNDPLLPVCSSFLQSAMPIHMYMYEYM